MASPYRPANLTLTPSNGRGQPQSQPRPLSQRSDVRQNSTTSVGGNASHQGQGDEGQENCHLESPEAADGQKKKRGQRAQVGDKAGKGLRHFSMKVCEKVESKGRTTYNEVADELVQEFSLGEGLGMGSEQIDEKNIRRRVYDALNVLMAMDIIAKEKKEIHWRGLPYATGAGFELLQGECTKVRSRIEKKLAHLQELQEQVVGQERLVHRNEASGVTHGSQSQGGIQLPFLLVQTRPQATVEVEISENMQLVNFDFNRTQFEVHDDSYVLRAMGLCQLDPRKPAVVAAPQREDQPGGAHLVPPHPVPVQLNGYAGPPPGHSHSNLGGAGTAQQ